MKVASNAAALLAASASASSTSLATTSILLRISNLGGFTSPSRDKICSASSSIPLRASIMTPTRSASCAPPHAVVTIARSRRRRGEKIPGVSTKISCERPSIVMPRTSARVVCTLCDMMLTFDPTSALSNVDLPALGAPISAMKPHLVSLACSGASTINFVRRRADPREHGRGGSLFSSTLGAADAFRGRAVRQNHGDAEFGIVVRPCPRQFAIGRSRQPPRLRPFLQHGFWVAQRTKRLEHSLFPEALDEAVGRLIAAIEKHRADQRLANIGKNRDAAPSARMRFRVAELQCRPEIHRARDFGAGLLAHQVGQAPRELSFIGPREGAIEHVGDDEAKHVIAEEFEPLIARRALASGQRGNMSERSFEQVLIGKLVADPAFERRPVPGLAAHLTIVNSLLQRTDTGQRQNCQARSPSYTEKKMICALPTMFSNGTMPTWLNRLSVELSRLSPIMK